MLEMILDKQIFFVLMGIFTVLGLAGKWVANASLKRLVRAAGNMGKSAHPLMRLIRAKFEHACMISERVENVGAFVDKYLYEYKVAGIRLHTWRRLEKLAAGMCFLLGLLGAAAWYGAAGMREMVLRTGAAGAGLGILILLVHMATDEDYQLEAARNYMMDYLENVCLHRYEKAYQKELKVMTPETPAAAAPVIAVEEAKEPEAKEAEVKEAEIKAAEIRKTPARETSVTESVGEPRPVRTAEEKAREEKAPETPKDVLIRQILEEFMA